MLIVICRVRTIHKKLEQTDSVILSDLDWLSEYMVQ